MFFLFLHTYPKCEVTQYKHISNIFLHQFSLDKDLINC